jgi:hypothetical protein
MVCPAASFCRPADSAAAKTVQDAEAEAGAQLMGDLDEAGGGQRAECGALAYADQEHRQSDAGEVRGYPLKGG